MIWIRSRTKRKCGDVYSPILEIALVSARWAGVAPMYCVRIDDMKADVDPFPFVPAIWIALRSLNADGCGKDQYLVLIGGLDPDASTHLITNLLTPFYHLRDRLFVHLPPRFPDRVDYLEVRLEGIERRDSILNICQSAELGN